MHRLLLGIGLVSVLTGCSVLLGPPAGGDGGTAGDGDGDVGDGDGDVGDGDGDLGDGDGDLGDGDGDAGDGDGDSGDGDGDLGDGDGDGDAGDGDGDGDLCGNGVLNEGEQCDTDLFGDLSCQTFGFEEGSLLCLEGCSSISLAGCASDCVPDCDGRSCGPDPVCGVSCGECAFGLECGEDGQCPIACEPLCLNQVCGADPICGTSCGSCEDDETCIQGTCMGGACEPQCGDQECGLDPICGTNCGICGEDQVCTADGSCVGAQAQGLAIVLNWTTLADLDLVLADEANPICSATACTFANCSPGNPELPDWDGSGNVSNGDPTLHGDLAADVGPEVIELLNPGAGIYTFGVHHYAFNTLPADATVEVFIDGVSVGVETLSLASREFWYAGRVAWGAGNEYVAFDDQIRADFDCDDLSGAPCVSDLDCPSGVWPDTQYCEYMLGDGSAFGQCVQGCRNDNVCPEGTICMNNRACEEPPGGDDGVGDHCGLGDPCDEGLTCRPFADTCVETCTPPGSSCDSSGQGSGCCAESGLPFCIGSGPAGGGECSCSPDERGDYSCL